MAETIRRRLLGALRARAAEPAGEPGADGAGGPGADGLWADVDYADLDVTDWAPFRHLVRLRALAVHRPDAALRALDAWLRLDPRCPNWWYDQLGAPRALGDAALLLQPLLPAGQAESVCRILRRAAFAGMTGQNLLWAAEVVIRRCLLEGDDDGLAEAFRRAATLLTPGAGEGVQPDYSFHQHGPQLYSGGYGHEFAVDMAALAALSAGTPLALPLDELAAYFLDGQRWMLHAGRYDIACMGRESTREGNARRGHVLEAAARSLADAGAPRAAELRAFGRGPGPGARYFPHSDYLAVHRAGWSAAVKTSSTRTVLSEAGNGEGLRGRHLCDGVTHLWRTGEEYADLWPVQDWRHLPGTTAAFGPGPPPPLADFGQDTGGSPFAGGLSDGLLALCAMHLDRDGVRARKAWFFFLEEYVALGAGITGDDPGTSVHTTIDQVALGELVVDSGTVRHNGVAYHVLDGPAPTVRAGRRTGRWSDINRSQSPRDLAADVLEIWLDHGPGPRDAAYAYLAVPGRAPDPSPVTVLANTPSLQAVRHSGLDVTQAVFHRPGTLTLPDGSSVTVSRPLLLQLTGADEVIAACPLAPGGVADVASSVQLRRPG
ncbi:polysaccharide lyase family 8 super-sandwich domain-containing protein [Nonomuraea typhae]|uniref:polysaccharide lyase family 8 super-sandwich domain-containing protein n=1 Tax=Nonomuraea typhae TaxID=2603600 RepID=UPI0012F7F84D|nr:polysaccharide lyase family 8 super-sandwich domain-containing protein [Nonomuraea typhae]